MKLVKRLIVLYIISNTTLHHQFLKWERLPGKCESFLFYTCFFIFHLLTFHCIFFLHFQSMFRVSRCRCRLWSRSFWHAIFFAVFRPLYSELFKLFFFSFGEAEKAPLFAASRHFLFVWVVAVLFGVVGAVWQGGCERSHP